MLKDLDRRDRKSGAESVRVLHPQYNESARKQGPAFVVVMAVIGIGIGLLVGYIFFGKGEEENLTRPVSSVESETQTQLSEARVESQVLVNPELIDVQSQGVEGGFELVLNFSDEADYQQRQPTIGVLNLTFSETRLVNPVSRVIPGNLAGLSINNVEGGLEVSLDTGVSTLFNIEKRSEGGVFVLSVVAILYGQAQVTNQSTASDSSANIIQQNRDESSDRALDEQRQIDPEVARVERDSVSTDRPVPVRVVRELSFEDQDNNVSQRSIGLAQRGQLIEAYRSLLEFIEDNPQAHKSRETLATLLISQNEAQQAFELLQQGLDVSPTHSPFIRLQARALIEGDDKEGALALLERNTPVLAIDPDYHDLMASLYQQLGDHQRAIETYQNLLRARPDEGRWWTAMGISHETIGNVSEAVGSYQTALQMPLLENNLREYTQSRIQVLNQ